VERPQRRKRGDVPPVYHVSKAFILKTFRIRFGTESALSSAIDHSFREQIMLDLLADALLILLRADTRKPSGPSWKSDPDGTLLSRKSARLRERYHSPPPRPWT
jgi:hypothetical protein